MRIGFAGIGNMGFAMAARLREQGWSVAVRDIDAGRERAAAALGAKVCATPAALASRSDCVIVAVVDAEQTQQVLFGEKGAAPALAGRGCVMLCPTIAPADTESIAARLDALGVRCIDAPMSGGPVRARDGSMSLMVACDDTLFERHRALIGALSSKVFRLGARLGDGARTKLVNNLIAAINLAGAAECMVLAERMELDLERTLDVIEQSSGQSWIGMERMRRAIVGDLAPRAHTTLLEKDSALALRAAQQAGFVPALGTLASRLFAQACSAGCRDLDDASLFEHLRKR